MDIAYPHIAERMFGRPLAIEPSALRAIMDGPIARRVLTGARLDADEAQKGRALRRSRLAALAEAEQITQRDGMIDYALTPDGIAIVPVTGVLSRRFDFLSALCGWTSYEGLGATLDAAIEDYRVKAVLLDVDSPGGEADGMLDIADSIIACRSEMPIWAVANCLAASAAYAIAGSASMLALPRLAEVGSIGCVAVHIDQSNLDAAQGLQYTAIYSGARKIDGWGHAPLSDGARQALQDGVDHVRDEFAQLVQRQGRLSAKDAIETEAAVCADQSAVDAGLADGIATFAEALAELSDEISNSKGARIMSLKSQRAARQAKAKEIEGEQPVETTAEVSAPQPEKAAEMTPPKPGETCQLCGQMMPDENDGDEGGASVTDAAATAEKPTETPASNVTAAQSQSAAYGEAQMRETIDLCHIAGKPDKARAFIQAKTPVDKVRAALLEEKASADDGRSIERFNPGENSAERESNARMTSWKATQEKVKAELGIGARK